MTTKYRDDTGRGGQIGGGIQRDTMGNRVPRGTAGRPTASPPAGGGPGTPGLPIDNRGRDQAAVTMGPGRGIDGGSSAMSVAQQTAQQNTHGATPFMQTPGMQIAGQRVMGQDIYNDPAVSAALMDFNQRTSPALQHRSQLMGLGRSTAALNSQQQAMGSMLQPLYESAMGREERRLGNLNTAAENELGRRERSTQRVADANQNQAQMLMQMGQNLWGRGQQTGQNMMQAGGMFRDIAQQGNTADLNDYLRRQALGETAVNAPFGGLASAGFGSMTSSTGK